MRTIRESEYAGEKPKKPSKLKSELTRVASIITALLIAGTIKEACSGRKKRPESFRDTLYKTQTPVRSEYNFRDSPLVKDILKEQTNQISEFNRFSKTVRDLEFKIDNYIQTGNLTVYDISAFSQELTEARKKADTYDKNKFPVESITQRLTDYNNRISGLQKFLQTKR